MRVSQQGGEYGVLISRLGVGMEQLQDVQRDRYP